jgi:hypothetical protein
MPTIRIDLEVFEGLKKLAEPLVDTPNSVIRRILEEKALLKKNAPTSIPRPTPANRDLEPTPQAVYEQFLIGVLEEQFQGRGDKRSVTLAVIEKMQRLALLRAADLELVATGETRAENAIAWGRNALKDRGLLQRHSPRGIWELTTEGRAGARALRSPAKRAG